MRSVLMCLIVVVGAMAFVMLVPLPASASARPTETVEVPIAVDWRQHYTTPGSCFNVGIGQWTDPVGAVAWRLVTVVNTGSGTREESKVLRPPFDDQAWARYGWAPGEGTHWVQVARNGGFRFGGGTFDCGGLMPRLQAAVNSVRLYVTVEEPSDESCARLASNGGPPAGAAWDREWGATPTHQRTWDAAAILCAKKTGQTLLSGTAVVVWNVGALFTGIGMPVAGAVGGFEVGGPGGAVVGGSTGLMMTKEYVLPAWKDGNDALLDGYSRVVQDPPDPKFKTVVRPAPVRIKRLTKRKGVSRRAGRAVTALVREQTRMRNISRALSATIDKAGGAKQAGDRHWLGVQTRAYVKYAKQLAASLDRLVKLQKTAHRYAKRSRLLSQPVVTRKQLSRRLKRKGARGFTKRERRALRTREGMSNEQIAALRQRMRTGNTAGIPRSAADVIGDRNMTTTYRAAAQVMRLFLLMPWVIDDAAARGPG